MGPEASDPDSGVADAISRFELPSRLGEMLIRKGLVDSDDVQAALAEQAAGSEWRLGRILVHRGAIDDLTLAQAIAGQFHVPVAELRHTPPRPEALARLPREAALQLQALPLSLDGNELTVAVGDPPTRDLRLAIERSSGTSVRLVVCPTDELTAALEYWYAEDFDIGILPVDNPFAASEEPDVGDSRGYEGAKPRFDDQIVDWLLADAERRGATAVHLDHNEDGLRVRYRIGPALVSGPHLPRAAGTVVCHRLLAAAALDPAGIGVNEGKFDADIEGRQLTCHVAAASTPAGTHVVVRTLLRHRGERRFETLGIHGPNAVAMRRILDDRRGVVVAASVDQFVREAMSRTIVEELGSAEHAVAVISPECGMRIPETMGLPATSPDAIIVAIHTARVLSSDAIVIDGLADPDATRAALDAASDVLVVLALEGDDPTAIATMLVERVSAFLVAGALRAVLVGHERFGTTTVDVHMVTEKVCQAILDIDDSDATSDGC